MKTKLLIFILCFASLSVMGQGTVTRKKQQTTTQITQKKTLKPQKQSKQTTVKMCDICEKPLSKCDYGGKHPYCSNCGKLKEKCEFKGVHPTSPSNSNAVDTNNIQSLQPFPEAAGYDITFACNVSSANLYIDGNAYGNASGVRFLKTGNHNIKVTADGYEDYTENIDVNRNNTSYTINMKRNLGTEKIVAGTTGILNGHEWVDLGLSVKWATCNVGASVPSDYGGYYAWGETSTKSRYDWDNCFDCVKPKKWRKDDNWNVYRLNGKTRISPDSGHDAAKVNWGSLWRMPTIEEFRELCDLCKWTYTSLNGKNGFRVEGPNGNHIFIPAAGCQYEDKLGSENVSCFYWSSDHSSYWTGHAQYLYAGKDSKYLDSEYRCCGLSIRPVTE